MCPEGIKSMHFPAQKSASQSRKENVFFLWSTVGFHAQYWLNLPQTNSSLTHKNLATHLVIQGQSQLNKLKIWEK